MRMLSKKDLTSGELETLLRSGSPKTVVSASGEVQTNEEAQVYVHDLHLFVTVQLLEDTSAVLYRGKLKEHGCTYEWPCDLEPRLTKKREANPLQNRELRPICSSRTIIKLYHNFFLDIAIAGSISNTRNHEEATENCSKGVAGNCNGRGIPDWLEDFTENLEIAEELAPADISHDSDPECPFKVTSRKDSIFTHFP